MSVRRVTNAAVSVEYQPARTDRVTNTAVVVEYQPPRKDRITNVVIVVEYAVTTPPFGPAVQCM